MQKLIVLMAAMIMVACGGVMAADKPAEKTQERTVAATVTPESKEKQMEKLGALRGRLMSKLAELGKAVDVNQNGAMVTYTAIQGIQGKVSQSIGKQLQEENVKAQDMRNQALVDILNKKNEKNNAMWIEFVQTDWAIYGKMMGEQYQVFQALTPIFGNVANIETAWSNSGIDLEMLIGVLPAVEKRADEVKAKVTATLSDINAKLAVWEAFAKE